MADALVDGVAVGDEEEDQSTTTTTLVATPEVIEGVRKLLTNKQAPITERFRAIFTLCNLGGHLAIDALIAGMEDGSALLRHEIAFVLGQMKDPYAIPFLTSVLEDLGENSMVRHEAGEALGAIGDPCALEVLQRYSNDPLAEVAETCQLAVDRIKWFVEHASDAEGMDEAQRSKFHSIDPAPPIDANATVAELRELLIDESKPMFHRYGAMFALRDIGSEEAVDALAAGFGAKSALLRHEIAYVFGQLQHPHSVPALSEVLSKLDEHPMVRHEAAEALGSIATPEVLETLQRYYDSDKERVVRESCAVALDIVDYMSSDSFQYANSVSKVAVAE